jgi:hypothetical protein
MIQVVIAKLHEKKYIRNSILPMLTLRVAKKYFYFKVMLGNLTVLHI